ncbi:PSP1 domain-containing protein [Owenweeksia hongkongensis]|uniref:PSP1 domain-containing protein n=1 Tax=Owenweeksia hongkongensis TaxID=253245 RepID=UPI003A8F23AE
MGCTNCSSNGLPKGCKSNGSCGTNSCDKLSVFDWLSNMEQPAGKKFEFVEVRFKNGRKEFYKNTQDLPIHIGDNVAVEGSPGHDIGTVSLTGELVRLQMRQKKVKLDASDFKKLYRKANTRDIEIWQQAREREQETMVRSRVLARELNLVMKISDVEYQGDGNKATFFYTAEERVDFRELIRVLASEFKIRVEMRQIGARQEAGRVGGIGSCGRELCCSTWLTDFRSVNTAAARYQQLALNPQKLAGQCGKLKCCLNYELDSYLDALKEFPDTSQNLFTQKGEAVFQKMDIFKGRLWYAYREGGTDWVAMDVSKVNEIVAQNKQNKKPAALEDYMVVEDTIASPTYESVIEQDSITRFDQSKSRNAKKRRNKKRPQGENPNALKAQGNQPRAQKPKGQKKPKGPRQPQGSKDAKPGNAPKPQGKPQGQGQGQKQGKPKPNNNNRNRRRPPQNPKKSEE